MKTYRIIFAITLIVTLCISCKSYDDKTSTYNATGIILGLDKAQCACCGNWMIQIDGEQKTRQFIALPENSDIDLNNTTFPLFVSLNWTESTSGCKFVIISEIKAN